MPEIMLYLSDSSLPIRQRAENLSWSICENAAAKEEKLSLCQVAQAHPFTFVFKSLISCRLVEVNFVHLCKWF